MFSILSKTDVIIWATYILSSANAFNLVVSKMLSFDKELKDMSTLRLSQFLNEMDSYRSIII